MTIEIISGLTTDQDAWVRELSTGLAPEDQIEHFPRFAVRSPYRDDGVLSLARTRYASLYVASLDPGKSGPEVQAYDDDAIWVVLAGEATFWSEGGRNVGRFGQYHGLLTPRGVSYRYENTGDGLLILLRGAGRGEPMEAYRDFYTGSGEGGTEAISWRRDPWPGVDGDEGPFKRFNLRFPLRGENVAAWRVLARTDHIAMHSSSLEPGRGEVNLHAHDDEAIWVVLFGQVTYYGEEDNRELCTLRAHDGIVIPQDQLYRYVNTGDGYLHMLRFAGRKEAPTPL